jgi:hypothetical protein
MMHEKAFLAIYEVQLYPHMHTHTYKPARDIESWPLLFAIVKDHFTDLGISITEAQEWGNLIITALEKCDTDLTNIPTYGSSELPGSV